MEDLSMYRTVHVKFNCYQSTMSVELCHGDVSAFTLQIWEMASKNSHEISTHMIKTNKSGHCSNALVHHECRRRSNLGQSETIVLLGLALLFLFLFLTLRICVVMFPLFLLLRCRSINI